MPKPTTSKSWLIPSVADLLFSVILVVLYFRKQSGLLGDGDTGYHIRAGQYILQTLSVPRHDLFSYHTPALPWTAHEWLAEVVMAAIHDLLGLSGVVAFFACLLALSTSLLLVSLRADQMRLQGPATGASGEAAEENLLLTAGVSLLAFGACQIHWLARPHVFSFLMMLGWHHQLRSWQHGGPNSLYLLPVSMVLWVNLHGGFLGGFILLGAYLTGNLWDFFRGPATEAARRRAALRQLAATTAACLVAALCNPNGYQILLFPFRLVSERYLMDHVTEFLSPNFHEFLPFKYLLLLLIAVAGFSRRAMSACEMTLILVFTNMSLYSARYIPLFALVLAPILVRHAGQSARPGSGAIEDFFRKRARVITQVDARSTGHLWPAAALILVLLVSVSGRVTHAFDAKVKPVAATEFLMRESVSGNMFNDDEFGDYLIYRAYPAYRVFFDGRSDMYGADRVREYCTVTNFEPGWEQVLEKYRIDWIFFGSNSNLCRYLQKDGNWVLIYSDPVASIFLRKLPKYGNLIAKYQSVQPAQL